MPVSESYLECLGKKTETHLRRLDLSLFTIREYFERGGRDGDDIECYLTSYHHPDLKEGQNYLIRIADRIVSVYASQFRYRGGCPLRDHTYWQFWPFTAVHEFMYCLWRIESSSCPAIILATSRSGSLGISPRDIGDMWEITMSPTEQTIVNETERNISLSL